MRATACEQCVRGRSLFSLFLSLCLFDSMVYLLNIFFCLVFDNQHHFFHHSFVCRISTHMFTYFFCHFLMFEAHTHTLFTFALSLSLKFFLSFRCLIIVLLLLLRLLLLIVVVFNFFVCFLFFFFSCAAKLHIHKHTHTLLFGFFFLSCLFLLFKRSHS